MATAVDHPRRAREFVDRPGRAHWHDQALWFIRSKRDRMADMLPEWEELRAMAAAIKKDTLAHLADRLTQFEANAIASGAVVHWAPDAAAHNAIVHKLLAEREITRVAKSKSMLTEECHLNPYLEARGITVTDTDLGEWIVQLRGETPSHIVLPAIHIKKEEVGETFHQYIGTPQGCSDPMTLARAARKNLREVFLDAQAGITGVNFAVAETGQIVICTNEGNADLGASLPKLHIASMGIEKLIPGVDELAVFIRLLARSATGQPITTYTSHFHGPRPDGELHIILVDNGRSEILGSEDFRRSLSCIRCGACMNTCPVYRRSGGHSYGATVPGPIGSILNPARDLKQYKDLPYACSLCGSCDDVCPVKIDIHHQLLAFRREVRDAGLLPFNKSFPLKMAGWLFANGNRMRRLGKIAKFMIRNTPRFLKYNRLNDWGRQRELPPMPKQSFRDLYREHQKSVQRIAK